MNTHFMFQIIDTDESTQKAFAFPRKTLLDLLELAGLENQELEDNQDVNKLITCTDGFVLLFKTTGFVPFFFLGVHLMSPNLRACWDLEKALGTMYECAIELELLQPGQTINDLPAGALA